MRSRKPKMRVLFIFAAMSVLILSDTDAAVVCDKGSGHVCCKLPEEISPGTQPNECECMRLGGTKQHTGRCPFNTDCKGIYSPVCCSVEDQGYVYANADNACACRNKKMGIVLSEGTCTVDPPRPSWNITVCLGDAVPLCCQFHDEMGSYSENATSPCGCSGGIFLHSGLCKVRIETPKINFACI